MRHNLNDSDFLLWDKTLGLLGSVALIGAWLGIACLLVRIVEWVW